MKPEFALIGAFGLAGATFLFPTVAIPFARSRPSPGARALTFEILVPAHDEEETLAETLASITRAIARCREKRPLLLFRIIVGADACRDRTAAIARAAGAEVRELSFQSKWKTLRALALASEADWCVLADAGVRWPERFLERLAELARREDLVGIAPAYHPAGSAFWEQWHWRLERCLKNLEARAGGPVTVHGATVAYRGSQLRQAIASLGEGPWLNDDVVIPWVLRAQNPRQRIFYWEGEDAADRLYDEGLAKNRREFGRRRRMLVGNLQWLSLWKLRDWHRRPSLQLLGLRRVFRLLWAYWLVLIALALLPPPAAIVAGAAVACAWRFGFARGLWSSSAVSLLTPYYWFASRNKKGEFLWS